MVTEQSTSYPTKRGCKQIFVMYVFMCWWCSPRTQRLPSRIELSNLWALIPQELDQTYMGAWALKTVVRAHCRLPAGLTSVTYWVSPVALPTKRRWFLRALPLLLSLPVSPLPLRGAVKVCVFRLSAFFLPLYRSLAGVGRVPLRSVVWSLKKVKSNLSSQGKYHR